MAAALSSDAGARAADLARRIGSNAAEALSIVEDLGEELPFIGPVLKTLAAIREKVETVKDNRGQLKGLEERCTYVTACVVVKCRQNPRSGMDLTPLEACLKDVKSVVDCCGGRGTASRAFYSASEKAEIAGLNARLDRVAGDLGLAGIAVLEKKTDDLKATLERIDKNQEIIASHLQTPRIKPAKVPKGTPMRKSWHVERRHVMEAVLKALSGDGGPCLVGLVGDSGAGKTTVASEIVRSKEVRETFSDGIVWLTVDAAAKERLPALTKQLARMVYEDMRNNVDCAPDESCDGAAYIKRCVERGGGGERLRCLVVADNVWEKEVVSQLLETGMWVLVSTRDRGLVVGSKGTAVGVDELSQADAKSVLREAAELSTDVNLPDDAADLIELCGRVAMDLAFVGRWSTVRGRQDRTAWSDAAGKVRAEMVNVESVSENGVAQSGRAKQRKAIFRAGFADLGTGSDDERVQRLYLSLSVLPEGFAFSVKDAAVLLHDRKPDLKDQASMRGVVQILERWAVVLRSTEGKYRMHDAHSSFAKSHLVDRGDVRRPALKRWVGYISSLEALRSFDPQVLKRLWLSVEGVGGDSWAKTRPYAEALAGMDEDDPLRMESIQSLGYFQNAQRDWNGASTTWRSLLDLRTCLDVDVACTLHILGILSVPETECLPGAEELLKHCLRVTEAKLGRTDVQVTKTLYSLGITVLEEGRPEEAEGIFRRCLDIEDAKRGRMDVDEEGYARSGQRVDAGDAVPLKEAEHLLRRSLLMPHETELDQGRAHMARAPDQLIAWVREEGRLDEVEEFLTGSLKMQKADVSTGNGTAVAPTLHRLGLCAREAGRLEDSEDLLRQSLAIAEADPGRKYVEEETAFALDGLGLCVRNAGRIGESEMFLRCSLRLQEGKLGQNSMGASFTLLQLGNCARQAGRLSEAEALLRRCESTRVAKLGLDDPQVAYAMLPLGLCIRDAGRLQEAEDLLRRCLRILEETLRPLNMRVAHTLHELSVCVRRAGRLEEAEDLLRRCLGIEEAKLGADDLRVANTLHKLGLYVGEAGRLEEAKELFTRCLSIQDAKLGAEHVDVASTMHQLRLCALGASRRVGSQRQDREALLALYWSSGGPRWKRNQGWVDNDDDLSSWHGVTLDEHGRVSRLDLNRNQLDGTIPAALGNLGNLLYLRMSFNSLTGPIPCSFGNLSRLNYLDIRSNQLTGSLPAEFGRLTEVSKVDFSCNLLGGHIPPEMGNMTGLMLCWLEKNHIQGPIPAELANIPQLTDLDLAENRIEEGRLQGKDLDAWKEKARQQLVAAERRRRGGSSSGAGRDSGGGDAVDIELRECQEKVLANDRKIAVLKAEITSRKTSRSRIDPKKLPSEISLLEIRVGLVREVTALRLDPAHAMIAVQVRPDDKGSTEQRTALWHFDAAPPRAGAVVVAICNLPSIKTQGILFTAVVMCMDDILLVPPPDSPIGELVTVNGRRPNPSKNAQAVSRIWEKVLSENLFQVGDGKVVRYEHKRNPGPLMTSKGPILCATAGPTRAPLASPP